MRRISSGAVPIALILVPACVILQTLNLLTHSVHMSVYT